MENESKNRRDSQRGRGQGLLLPVFCAILSLALLIGALLVGLFLPAQYDSTFSGELKYKRRILAQENGTASGRIVCIGGSSVVFGVDTALLAQELSKSAVNFGSYAGFGLGAMLDLALPDIQTGDTVIVFCEQQAQMYENFFDPKVFLQAADGDLSMLKSLSGERRKRAAFALPDLAVQKARHYFTDSTPDPEGIYARRSFTDDGNLKYGLATDNVMADGADLATPVDLNPSIITDEWAELVDTFARQCKDKGALVYFHFGPMNEASVKAETKAASEGEIEDTAETFCQVLEEKITVPVLSDPYACILPQEYFYDTNFHLNDEGRILFTGLLVRELKAVSEDNSETSLPTYGMVRGVPEKTKEMGDTAQEAAEEESVQKEEKSVLTADTYAGNTTLTKVTIPESVGQIEDGAFEGCSALRAIVLESKEPSSCIVGTGLLDGTAAMLCVPDTALSDYKVNYFWSQYADRILPVSDLPE